MKIVILAIVLVLTVAAGTVTMAPSQVLAGTKECDPCN
jgi:hypothetical protein